MRQFLHTSPIFTIFSTHRHVHRVLATTALWQKSNNCVCVTTFTGPGVLRLPEVKKRVRSFRYVTRSYISLSAKPATFALTMQIFYRMTYVGLIEYLKCQKYCVSTSLVPGLPQLKLKLQKY